MILQFLKTKFPKVKYPVKYVIRKKALGDVLWIEPLIIKLLERSSKIVVVSDYCALFENYPNPNVSFRTSLNFFEKILCFFDRTFRFKLFFINLNESYEQFPRMHMLLAYYIISKVNDKIIYPTIYFSREETATIQTVSHKYVVLHIETYLLNNNYRNVYGVNWEVIVGSLKSKGYEVIQVGRKENLINGAEFKSTSIREMAVLIKGACFFIGPDSGPSHLAASLKIPAIIFFGSVNPAYRQRLDIFKGIILQQPCEYANCFHEDYNKVRRTCILFGHQGIPKCAIHSNEIVLKAIDNLILKYSL